MYSSSGPDTTPYTVIAVDANIDPTRQDGTDWCAAGTSLSVEVDATLDGTSSATPEVSGLAPTWNSPLFSAPANQYADGLFLDVRGSCDGSSTFRVGAALIHPSQSVVENGGLQLFGIGSVGSLRLAFSADDATDSGGSDTPIDPFPPYYVSDDGSSDISGGYEDDSGTYDDGSGGDCGCDGSDGSTDGSDGSADGSDSGGDGSDSGGDGTESVRVHHPRIPAHRHTAHQGAR